MQNLLKERGNEKWLIKIIKNIFPELNAEKNIRSEENNFLSTTIKNWLSSVNELGYQFPFCQYLISKGFSICHNSKHNAFEQGKDIIAKDKKGNPYVFQLKGGNITISSWNNTIKAEAEKLIDLKIVHPSIDKNRKHISYLVLNGDLEDTVRLEIDNLNQGKWSKNPLRVITIGELEQYFQEISRDFEPRKTADYKTFLELYFLSGDEMVDEEKICNFLYELLRIDDTNKISDNERKRNIDSSIVYTGYIIANFQKKENHIAVIHILTLLVFSILALVEKYNLKKKYWKESVDLIYNEINKQSSLLEKEISEKGIISLVTSIWDGELGKFRRYLAASYLLSVKLSQILYKSPDCKSLNDVKIRTELSNCLIIWGESSIFPFICNFLYYKKINNIKNNDNLFKLLESIIDVIIKANGRKGTGILFSPYYNILSVIKNKYGLLDEPIDESFNCSSFYIKPVVDLMAHYDRKDYLEKNWREISYISNEKFVPDKTWMNFLWRCDKSKNNDGVVRSEFPNKTQSWSLLKKESNVFDKKIIPKVFSDVPYLLPLFLLVYPHRINSDLIKFLDDEVGKTII